MAKTKKVRLPVTTTSRDKDGNRLRHGPGTELTLPVDEADALVARYGEAKAPPHVSSAPERPRKPEGAALAKAIQAAANGLDRESEEDFTRSGKPSVPALEKVLGYDITADERDAAIAAGQD